MTKIKKCYSIEDELAGRINQVALVRGLSDSEMIQKYITTGLSRELEVTAVERYHLQRKIIMNSLDSVLRTMGIVEYEGGISDKLMTCLYIGHGQGRLKKRDFRSNLIELSIFEVLHDVSFMDKNLFEDIRAKLRLFGKMRKRYDSLYP